MFPCLCVGTRPPQALGMANGQILDAQLSASSSDADWEPKHARLQSNGNGWAATTPAGSWFQVKLPRQYLENLVNNKWIKYIFTNPEQKHLVISRYLVQEFKEYTTCDDILILFQNSFQTY